MNQDLRDRRTHLHTSESSVRSRSASGGAGNGPRAHSYARAARSTSASLPDGPMICRPVGNPPGNPQGTLAAGKPVWLHHDVNGGAMRECSGRPCASGGAQWNVGVSSRS
ncbi:hypothetical protein BVI1335_750042 [Burkholderia vietnamiensis]|nr:hypothetical protein BVI1335_750042 [Burkholderia vietnamiensis]